MYPRSNTSCFKSTFKPIGVPIQSKTQTNFVNATSNASIPTPQSICSYPVLVNFPCERANIYKNLLGQINSLKTTVSDLLNNLVQEKNIPTSSISSVLEMQLLSKVTLEFKSLASQISETKFFQALAKELSLKRMLDEICLLGPYLDTPHDHNTPTYLPPEHQTPTQLQNRKSTDSSQVEPRSTYFSFKFSELKPNLDADLFERQHINSSGLILGKSELKKYLTLVTGLFQNKHINSIEKNFLKKGILLNHRDIIRHIKIYERDLDLKSFIELLEQLTKEHTPQFPKLK